MRDTGFLKSIKDRIITSRSPISLVDNHELRDDELHNIELTPLNEGKFSDWDLYLKSTLDEPVAFGFSWLSSSPCSVVCTDGTVEPYRDPPLWFYHAVPTLSSGRNHVALSELPLKMGANLIAQGKQTKTPTLVRPWKKFTLNRVLEDELGTTTNRVYLWYRTETQVAPTAGSLSVIFIGKK